MRACLSCACSYNSPIGPCLLLLRLPRRRAVSGEVQSGTYDASPDYYAVHTYTTLHLHQYYYGAFPTVRLQFALTEVYESAYIPLDSTPDLQFCAAPHTTVLNVHIVLYILCTVQDQLPDGLADRPLLFPSFGVHLSSLLVILSTLRPLGRLPNPSRRDVVRFMVLCASPLISTRGNIKGSNPLDRHRSPCLPPASL